VACRAETLGGAFAVFAVSVGSGRRGGDAGSVGVLASDASVAATVRGEFAARTAGVGVTAPRAISAAALGGVRGGDATDFAPAEPARGSFGVTPEATAAALDASMEPTATGTGTGTATGGAVEGCEPPCESDSAWSGWNSPNSLPSSFCGRLDRREFANLASEGAAGISESAL